MNRSILSSIIFAAIRLATGATLLLGLAGCASSRDTRVGKQQLFADPAQFESLASGAFESPNVASVAPVEAPRSEPVVANAPVHGAALVSAPEVFDATTPEAAYITMLRGNERFVAGITRGEHRDETRRRSLASEQNPHTIVLSCSDSRVPPELIFDQGLGDLYTIRVSGNVLGSAQVASIETAVEKHGAKLIVVMGHESCDSVKAAMGNLKVGITSTDQAWLASEIRPNVVSRGLASAHDSGASDGKIREPVMANVDAVTEQLLLRSKIVSSAIQSGKLRMTRAIYSLDSGRVDFWGTK